jgi:hypothetical protein
MTVKNAKQVAPELEQRDKALFLSAASRLPLDIEDLRTPGYIDDKELDLLKNQRIRYLSELYSPEADKITGVDPTRVRTHLRTRSTPTV